MATYDPKKMLPYTPGQGAGIGAQIAADPTKLRSLLGGGGPATALPGGLPGVPAATPGATPGASPAAGGDPLFQQLTGNLSGALKGELPPDVINMLQQQNAEHAVGGGFSGSQAANYGGLRTLGLTSLDRMQKAEQELAGGLINPAERERLDIAKTGESTRHQEFLDSQRLAQQKLDLERQAQAQAQALEQQKLQQQKMLYDLQALGGKYGNLGQGGPAVGGGQILPGMDYGLSKTSPGQWQPMQFGVTSML